MKTIRILAAMLLAAVAASFLGAIPFESRDVGDLTVAELLCLTADHGVNAVTESGLAASGATVEAALSRLREIAPGHLLLATVSCVTVCGFRPSADVLLGCGLRPATKIFAAPAELDPEKAAAYLAHHDGGVTLGALREQPDLPLPRLACENGMPFAEAAP